MINYAEIPEYGTVFAIYRDRIVFGRYQKLDSESYMFADGTKMCLAQISKDTELLELHLFDQMKEYRCVKTRQRGLLEILIDGRMDASQYEDIYSEEVYILGKDIDQQRQFKQKIGIVNYIRYNDDDLLIIDNYRLREVE